MDANLKAEILAAIFGHENRMPAKKYMELAIAKGWPTRDADFEDLFASQQLAFVDGNFLLPNPQAYYASLSRPAIRPAERLRKR